MDIRHRWIDRHPVEKLVITALAVWLLAAIAFFIVASITGEEEEGGLALILLLGF